MAEGATVVRVPDGNPQGELTHTAVLLDKENHDVLAFGQCARERFAEDSTTGMLFRRLISDLYGRGGAPPRLDGVTTAEGGEALCLELLLVALLRHFKEVAIAHLSSVSDEAPCVTDITWVLTFAPTSSDDDVKRFLHDVLHKAGITTETVGSPQVMLCPQSNAAYLAVYSQDMSLEPRELHTKTLVLDCGGTTVDIATHEVISLNPLRLRELLRPTGGPWGSHSVDNEFLRWFEGFVGHDAYKTLRQTEAFEDLVNRWEKCKQGFGGREKEEARLDIVEVCQELSLSTQKIQVRACGGDGLV